MTIISSKTSFSTDQELCDEIIKKNPHALSELYKKYNDKIELLVFVRLRKFNRLDLINDLKNDIWFEILNSLISGKFSDSGNLDNYVLGIFYNVFPKRLKIYNDFSTKNYSNDQELELLKIVRDNPDIDYDEKIFNLISRRISKMDPKLKNVIQLRFYQNMSYEQIANTLNISVSTVSGRIKRAVENLRPTSRKNFTKNKGFNYANRNLQNRG